MNFTNEQINKAKSAKSAEELLALAKASGIEMTAEQANAYFAELHKEGELTDGELASIAGGGKYDPEITKTETYKFNCPFCHQIIKIVLYYYDDKSVQQDKSHCGCGAEVTVCNGSITARFKKDGQTIFDNDGSVMYN